VLADQALLKVTQDTLTSETDSYNLTNAMFKRGTTTLLSLRQAETAVDTARANLALYTRQSAQDENALVLLLGEPMPADLPAGKGLDNQGLLSDLPAGLPSDLLFRRPDVVAAEHNLIAANANIGAARAAFFPSISLTASGGVAGSQLNQLFTSAGTTWSFTPQINIPIFTAGQNQGNLDLAKVQKNIQVAQYEKTIQTAFREVSDALAARTTYIDQVRAQQQLVDAAADSVRLSTMLFKAGVDNYLPVLTAEQTLYPAQQTLLSLKLAQLANLVTLYKALGGGWNERTIATATTPRPL
jgi:multidrug efflux system outer membrane protein